MIRNNSQRGYGQYASAKYLNPGLVSWLTTADMSMHLFTGENKEGDTSRTSESGPEVNLLIKQTNSAHSVFLRLSKMTNEDLHAIKQFLRLLQEVIEPVIELRDREARDAEERGEFGFQRLYRALPAMHTQERALNSYRESLQRGLENVVGSDGDANDPDS